MTSPRLPQRVARMTCRLVGRLRLTTYRWRQLAPFAPQEKGLITRSRTKASRNIAVTLLREDRTKRQASSLAPRQGRVPQLQLAFWTKGYDEH